jgi:hypothetical protein
MRQTDGYDTYGPELAEYRSHIGPFSVFTDSDGEPLVTLQTARSAERALRDLLCERHSSFSRGAISRIWRKLRKQLPPDVPRLTAFKIV